MTTNERHRIVLGAVIEHMKAEAVPDMHRLMATLVPSPDYHFWNGGRDRGPKGREGVRSYYESFVASGTNVLEYVLDRVVVDEDCVVTEGYLRQIFPGMEAVARGFEIDNEAGDYLIEFRQLILWPVDHDGLITGEDSYQSGPCNITEISVDALPDGYIASTHS